MTAAHPSDLPDSFEAAMAELEVLVGRMESGRQPLEASLEDYRRGVALVRLCQQRLEAIEEQVKRLDGDLLKPMEATGES